MNPGGGQGQVHDPGHDPGPDLDIDPGHDPGYDQGYDQGHDLDLDPGRGHPVDIIQDQEAGGTGPDHQMKQR